MYRANVTFLLSIAEELRFASLSVEKNMRQVNGEPGEREAAAESADDEGERDTNG